MFNLKIVEDFPDGLVDNIINGFGLMIESGDRG
jgi:hypothetical protein